MSFSFYIQKLLFPKAKRQKNFFPRFIQPRSHSSIIFIVFFFCNSYRFNCRLVKKILLTLSAFIRYHFQRQKNTHFSNLIVNMTQYNFGNYSRFCTFIIHIYASENFELRLSKSFLSTFIR